VKRLYHARQGLEIEDEIYVIFASINFNAIYHDISRHQAKIILRYNALISVKYRKIVLTRIALYDTFIALQHFQNQRRHWRRCFKVSLLNYLKLVLLPG